jgi:hypothetical protein
MGGDEHQCQGARLKDNTGSLPAPKYKLPPDVALNNAQRYQS